MRRKWMACFLVLTMLTGMFPTALAAGDADQGEPDAPICTNEAGCTAAEHDPTCPAFEASGADIGPGPDLEQVPENPENQVCTQDETCTADIHDPACPHYPVQEAPEIPEELDTVSCTQDDTCRADDHDPACPLYQAQHEPDESDPVREERTDNSLFSTGSNGTDYDHTVTVTGDKIQDALNNIPENAGDVLLLVNQNIEITKDKTAFSIPTDRGITSLTIGTDSSVTIGSEYNTGLIYANGVPLTIDSGVTLGSWMSVFGGGKSDISGDIRLTVNEGAAVDGFLYGGGRDSDVDGDVSIVVKGSVGTIYGGGYAFGGNQKGDLSAHANVDGDISIQVTGEQSALSDNLYGGGYAYFGADKAKDDVQSMQANVTGSISIYLDSPNLSTDLELYGGGHAEMRTNNSNNSNVTLEANVADITIELSGNTHGTEAYDVRNDRKIYGGGYAYSFIDANKETNIENTSITANVYGTISIDASENNHAISTADKRDNSTLWSLYGGGFSSGQFTTANVNGDTHVKSCRKTLNSRGGTLGGGCAYQGGVARVTGDTHVEIFRASSQPSGHENAKGVIGGGEGGFHGDATVEGSTYIKIHDNIAFESSGTGIVGGGYASDAYGTASVLGNVTVDVGDGYASSSQFVGGGYAAKQNCTATIGDPDQAPSQISITFHGVIQTRAGMYGAGRTSGAESNASVYGDVNATFDGAAYQGGPTLWAYIGGYAENNSTLFISGDVFVHITNKSDLPSFAIMSAGLNTTIGGNTKVIVDEDSYCDTVYGGGQDVRVQHAEIQIQNARVQSMYGGGYGASSHVENVVIKVNQSQITNRLYGGSNTGSVQNADIQISNSTLQRVYGGGDTGTSETVIITIDDSTTSWLYPAGYSSAVTGDVTLTLLGATTIAGSHAGGNTTGTIGGKFQILVGDGVKPTRAISNSNLYYNNGTFVKISDNAILEGTDTQYDLLWSLQALDIAPTGKLVLSRTQVFTGELSGKGTIVLPQNSTLTLNGSLTGTIALEMEGASVNQTLAFSKKNATTGSFVYKSNDGLLLVQTKNESYPNDIVWTLVQGYPVTASVIPLEDGTAGGTAAPASQAVAAGGDAQITITRNPGYKVAQILVNGTDQTDALEGNQLTLHNVTSQTEVVVRFEKMAAADIHDSTQSLPEPQPDQPLDEQEKETILDTKLDYEALPDEEKTQISEESRNKLNEALAALPEVEVSLELALDTEAGQDVVKAEEDLPALLENMTDDEAKAIKDKVITQYKLQVKVAAADPTPEIEASINNASAEYTAADHFDVTVQKIVTKTNADPDQTLLTSLAQPITLTFTIPDELLNVPGNTTRTFSMLHTHLEGTDYSTTALEDLDDKLETYTIRSDRFSVYTLAYKDTQKNNSSNSSHTSGSSTPSYSILTDKAVHGSITADRKRASKGTRVTITVKPDDGYMLDDLVVTGKSGTTVKLTEQKENQYTFTMPGEAVTLTAEFVSEEPKPESLPFSDVSDDAWYADAVRYVYAHGLMRGTNDTAFSPDASTTRGMIVTILYRMEGAPSISERSSFADVPADRYDADAIAWAAANGIVSGYDDRTFGPDDPITREQMAAILYRYAGWKGYDVSANANLSAFADVNAVSRYALEALQWANAAALVSGTSSTTLTPGAHASRAQVAAILTRFCQRFLDELS